MFWHLLQAALLACAYQQLDQDWEAHMADVVIAIAPSGGLVQLVPLGAAPALLQHLRKAPWVPTWAGLRQPKHAIARTSHPEGTHKLLQDVFQEVGACTVIPVEVCKQELAISMCMYIFIMLYSISSLPISGSTLLIRF